MSGLTTLNNPGNSLSLPDPGNATITIGGDVTGNSTFTTNQSANETISLSLDNDVVDTAEIADDAVTRDQMADNAVGTDVIAEGAVTFAKIQNIATNRVLGRTAAGSGDVSAIQVDADMIADDAVTSAKVADDAIGIAQLSATGTASSTTYLRGDNSWAAAGGSGVSTDVGANGIGSMALMTIFTNNQSITSGSTLGGNNLVHTVFNTSGTLVSTGPLSTGTWRNITGKTLASSGHRTGTWQRTS